ncbi:MAG: EAL domain-containing protein [Endozoicomonas sp. (ex Botrylloides leachii)]|nr:EAL domain-containing protein [Endozoicomonas sp. (ex Botrylloides leachii)]
MEQYVRDVTRLLIVDANTEAADHLVNVFRDSGQTTRAQHITDIEALEKAFLEKKKWDLLIISQLPDQLTLDILLESLEHQNADIPIIIIDDADGYEQVNYLRKEVKAVVPSGQQDMLLLKANQEIENLYIRRNYRRMSIALNESERQRRMLLDDEIDAIIYLNDGVIRYANPAFADLLGKPKDYVFEGMTFADIVTDTDHEHAAAFIENMEETGQALGVLQCSISLEPDNPIAIRAIIKPTSYDGTFSLSMQIKSADSSVIEAVEKNSVEEEQDSLGSVSIELKTKSELLTLLEISVQQVASGKAQLTLVHVSIDGLSDIHKDKGIRVSQKLERMVGDQIVVTLSTEHVVSSLGGGVFLLLLHTGSETEVNGITAKLLKELSLLSLEDKSINISLSMGAIILGDTGKNADTLMVRAKEACAQSEKNGGGQLSYYKPRKVKTVKSVEKHLAIMLRQAMKADALKLYYQPIVSLKGAESCYYEVLFSMTDIRGREHQASSFRSKLDNDPLWKRVDRWQFLEVSKALLAKRKDGQDIRAFIHLGGSALIDEKFIPWVNKAIKETDLPTSSIILDVSEVNITRYAKDAAAFFKAAKQSGFVTSVSEFGCSVSPLDIIETADADFIKLDSSFTKDLTTEGRGDDIKEVLVKLAEKHKQVIVPQVQNPNGLASLWHHSVDFVQGEFLQPPEETMDYSFDSNF